jgi:TRAP-type C4-dicarboxylate transport system substrate-binding protein
MRLLAILISIAAALFACFPAAAQERELILVHSGAPSSLYEISANEFARRLDEKLPRPYRVTVMATPPGDGLASLDEVKNGRASFALVSSAMSAVGDCFAIFELPFLIRSRDQVRNIRGALFARHLEPAAEAKGFRILGVWEDGFRHLTNDVRPITRPKDLEGLKIAVPAGNIWREKALRAFGADPVPMALRAIPDALRTKLADGQEAPLGDIAAWKLAETQRHLSLSDHLYSPAFLVVRKAAFEALPADVRDSIAREALSMETWIQTAASKMESELVDMLDWKMELGQIDLDSFRTASAPLYGEFIRSVPGGSKMIEAMQQAGEVTASGRAAN